MKKTVLWILNNGGSWFVVMCMIYSIGYVAIHGYHPGEPERCQPAISC